MLAVDLLRKSAGSEAIEQYRLQMGADGTMLPSKQSAAAAAYNREELWKCSRRCARRCYYSAIAVGCEGALRRHAQRSQHRRW